MQPIRLRKPQTKYALWVVLTVALSGILAACRADESATPYPELDIPIYPADDAERYQAIYNQTWEAIEADYVYNGLEGLDLDALKEGYAREVADVENDAAFYALLDEMLGVFPAGTVQIQSRETRLDPLTRLPGGIGAFVSFTSEPEPRIVLLSIFPGSPAEEAGLAPHDSILAIDGQPVTLEEGMNSVARVRGEIGEPVLLTVRTPGGDPRDVELNRGRLQATAIRMGSAVLPDDVGYIILPPQSYPEIFTDLSAVLENMLANPNQRIRALIFDLRISSGAQGWPEELVLRLWEFFIDEGIAIGELYDAEQSFSLVAQEVEPVADVSSMPIAILIGSETRGYAEVFAAGMKSRENTILVGQTTLGAVELITNTQLLDGSDLLIAVGSFRDANGVEIGLEGVRPDILLAPAWGDVIPTDDPVLERAYTYLIDEIR
jgi:carboxyl-terminal processing protease